MSRAWIRENPPLWDERKAAVIGAAPAGSLPDFPQRPGALLPGEWWRVEEDGRVVGYGWMETTWGDGEILLAVSPAAARRGVGAWIVEQLASEAAQAGLNYVHNVVRESHPRRAEVTAWLGRLGFSDSGDGRLRRRVRPATEATSSQAS